MNHLQEVDETYLEHGYHASKLGLLLIGLGLCCLVHAIFPSLFTKSVSSRLGYIVSLTRRKK